MPLFARSVEQVLEKVVFVVVLATTVMTLSSTVRAFSTMAARRVVVARPALLASTAAARAPMVGLVPPGFPVVAAATTTRPTARWLASSNSQGADATTVVDVCQRKIRDALQAVDVKVTGAYCIVWFVCFCCSRGAGRMCWVGSTLNPHRPRRHLSRRPHARPSPSHALLPPTILRPGAYDDPNGSHISIEVVSSLFEGKRPVQRQQLVYKAIWEELRGPVHAVDAMVCQTPAEAAAAT